MNDPRLKKLRLESSEKHRQGTLFYKVEGLGNVLCVSSHSGKKIVESFKFSIIWRTSKKA